MTTRFTTRQTLAATGTTFAYAFKPSLSLFVDQLNNFHEHFQFFRITNMKVTAVPTMTTAQSNGSTLYQLPYAVVTPIRNGDIPSTIQHALSVKGARHGIFHKPMSLAMKPTV